MVFVYRKLFMNQHHKRSQYFPYILENKTPNMAGEEDLIDMYFVSSIESWVTNYSFSKKW